MTDRTRTHDPRGCSLCASLRHPATSAQAAQLRDHLKRSPLPLQKDKEYRR
jgi:hypothetical protein